MKLLPVLVTDPPLRYST